MHQKITGLIAAPYTPFKKNGDLNLDIIPQYAKWLKDNDVRGAFIGGTTGEGLLLTIEERIALADAWIKEQSKQFKIFIHVAANSYRDAQELSAHAQKIRPFAISAMGPLFLKPGTIENLIEYCLHITAPAPDVPFYYYHIPSISSNYFQMHDFVELASKKLKSLVGIKYSDSNLLDLNLCLNHAGRKWDILFGQDETLLAAMALGVEGAIGSTYNYIAPLYHEMINYYLNNEWEEARKLQLLSAKFVKHLVAYGGAIAAGKSLMKLIGLDCGPCRSPSKLLKGQSLQEFVKLIKLEGLEVYMKNSIEVIL